MYDTICEKKEWKLHVGDQILMTPMKVVFNLLLVDLARRFGVLESFVSKTISYWLDTLAAHLSSLIAWLPRETIRATRPPCFKRYPKTACTTDCAKTIMQKPCNSKSSGESYSNYKSHNTVKYCVAVAPSGVIMLISRAYRGGQVTSLLYKIVAFFNNLLPGDEAMADRGFTIQDLLFPLRVKLNIPAFTSGEQLSDEEVTITRRRANVRIHVVGALKFSKF